jgi:hypothetical protein
MMAAEWQAAPSLRGRRHLRLLRGCSSADLWYGWWMGGGLVSVWCLL